MRGCGVYEDEADFEQGLYKKMKNELDNCLITIENRNKQLESTAESMRLSILGKDARTKDDKPLEVVNVYVKENKTELIDPLGVQKKIQEIYEKREKRLAELDTKIKVSNATTFVEF